MEIRNITKNDLPKLAELINSEELKSHDDICYEKSKMLVGDNGDIQMFVESVC